MTSLHNVSGGTLIFLSIETYGIEYLIFDFSFAPSRKEITKLNTQVWHITKSA